MSNFSHKPISRKEKYMAYLAGDTDIVLPLPLTREEINLYNACINGAGVMFGEETTVKEVLAECQPEYVDFDGAAGFVLADSIPVAIGEKYIINWNGTDYSCVGFDADGSVGLGNSSLLGGEDTGEPFFVCVMATGLGGGYDTQIMPLDGSTTLTISIRQEVIEVKKISGKYVEGMGYEEDGVVHPIDPKFLPFGEEFPNILIGFGKYYRTEKDDAEFTLCYFDRLNRYSSYDFVIRGDRYENVTPYFYDDYYEYYVWGDHDYHRDNPKYPFSLEAYADWYNEDGNFIYTDMVTEYFCPKICVRSDVYPDLKFEEIQIFERTPKIKKMSGKYVEGMGYVGHEIGVIYGNEAEAFTYGEDYGYSVASNYVTSHLHSLVNGEKYTVVFDGVTYSDLVAVAVTNVPSGYIYIGANPFFLPNSLSEDTPFAILTQEYDGVSYMTVYARGDAPTHSISVTGITKETIHPIDQKFIVLSSPNGTKYNLSVADDGTLSAVAAT